MPADDAEDGEIRETAPGACLRSSLLMRCVGVFASACGAVRINNVLQHVCAFVSFNVHACVSPD